MNTSELSKRLTIMISRLREMRKKRGVTQEQLASMIGVQPNTVWRWENNKASPMDCIIEVADALQTSVAYLTGEVDDPSLPAILIDLEGDPKINTLKKIAKDPRKFAAASLLADMDEAQLSKAYGFLLDLKQLEELKKLVAG